jgi:hypothetical protein
MMNISKDTFCLNNNIIKNKTFPAMETIVIIMALWIPFQNCLTKAYPILPSQLVWLDEFLVVVLVAIRLLRGAIRPKGLNIRWSFTELYILLFIIAGMISVIINNVPWFYALMGYKSLLVYAPLYFILSTEYISEGFAAKFVKAVIFMAVVQAPAVLLQMSLFYVRFGWIDDDSMFGTFARYKANEMGYFIGLVFFLLAGLLRYFPDHRKKILLLMGVLTIPLLASSCRTMIFLLPLLLLWLERHSIMSALRRRKSKNRILALIMLIIAIFGAQLFYLTTRGFDLERLSFEQFVADHISINTRGEGGRFLHVVYTYVTLKELPWGMWLGMGPGMYTSGTGWFLHSPGLSAINRILGKLRHGEDYYEGMVDPVTGMEFQVSGFSQLTSTMGEWGLIGFLLYALVVYTFVKKGVAAERDPSNSPMVRALGVGVQGIALLSLLIAFFISAWEEQTLAFCLWAVPGVMMGLWRSQVSNGKKHAENSGGVV